MFGMGVPELLIILFIIMLLFGARKLPDLASGLGGAVSNFRKALKGDEESVKTIKGRSASTTSGEPVSAPKSETTKT
jgi:sec-independent protein translocase protein TatA